MLRHSNWERLRLKDRIGPGLRVLFVGINPGVRSAVTGHHFAGYSNRFWKLLYDSRLVPEPVTFRDDDRMPGWGYGITNLIARPSRGIDALRPREYAAARAALERKVRRVRPRLVALVGVTLYRALFPAPARAAGAAGRASPIGPRPERLAGVPIFVLPNPSGRNANFTYAEMLEAFVRLREAMDQASGFGQASGDGGSGGAKPAGLVSAQDRRLPESETSRAAPSRRARGTRRAPRDPRTQSG